MSNQNVYEKERVVKTYAESVELHRAEEAVLQQFRAQLQEMRMLDIGVGGGRTTIHFAPQVKEYVGIDYSLKMVEACAKRFSEHRQKYSFQLCDARAMSFPDNHFDFVLFSFNGIDYVSSEERQRILREIARVTRPGGLFFFSSHNLNSDVEEPFVTYRPTSFKRAFAQTSKRVLFRLLNRNWRNTRTRTDSMILNDGAHGFRLHTHYIKPTAQIRDLKQAGFTDVKVFAQNGNELKPSELETARDPWLHYLCNAMKAALFLRLTELTEIIEFDFLPYSMFA